MTTFLIMIVDVIDGIEGFTLDDGRALTICVGSARIVKVRRA